jgi:hypothetical protein
LLRPTLGSGRVEATPGEKPDDDESGERLYQAVCTEADQRDGACRDPGTNGNPELDEVPSDAAPRKDASPTFEACPLGRR